jgi:hypothetical protein
MKCDRWPVLIGGGLVLAACSPSAPPAKLQPHRMVNVAGTPEAVARCVQVAMVANRYSADLTTGGTDGAAFLVVRGGTASPVIWEAAFRKAGPSRTQVQVWRDDELFPHHELVSELVHGCAGRMD